MSPAKEEKEAEVAEHEPGVKGGVPEYTSYQNGPCLLLLNMQGVGKGVHMVVYVVHCIGLELHTRNCLESMTALVLTVSIYEATTKTRHRHLNHVPLPLADHILKYDRICLEKNTP